MKNKLLDKLIVDKEKINSVLKDSLIKVYGEDYISLLNEKINDFEVITFLDYEIIANHYAEICDALAYYYEYIIFSNMNTLFSHQDNISYKVFLDDENNDFREKFLLEYNIGVPLAFNSSDPLNCFEPLDELTAEEKLHNIILRCEFFKPYIPNITFENYESFKEDETFLTVLNIYTNYYISYREISKGYNNDLKLYKSLTDYLASTEDIYYDLQSEYELKMFNKLITILPDYLKDYVNNIISKIEDEEEVVDDIFLNGNLYAYGSIIAFTKKCNELLESNNLFLKDDIEAIIEKRLYFYSLLGYENISDLKEFEYNNQELKPNCKLVSEVEKIIKHYNLEFYEKMKIETGNYQEMNSILKKYGITNTLEFINGIYNYSFYKDNKLIKFMIFNYLDNEYIHNVDLNYIYNLIKIISTNAYPHNSNKCIYSGLVSSKNDEYSNLNTLILLLISFDVYNEVIKEKKVLFMYDPVLEEDFDIYGDFVFLIKDLYLKLKDIFLQATINNDINILNNLLGEENVNKLNSLIDEYINLSFNNYENIFINKKSRLNEIYCEIKKIERNIIMFNTNYVNKRM